MKLSMTVTELAFKDGKDARLVSRNKKAFDYPQLVDALKKLPAERAIVDGEIAALDAKGRSSFQLLQLFKRSGDVPLVYYVFDLLSLEDKDLRNQPLSARRKALATLLKNPPYNIRFSDELRGSNDELVRAAPESGLEGLVAKRNTLSTKAAGAAAPGSSSRSPRLKSSLSVGTHSLKVPAATSAPCWSVITVQMG